MIYKRASTRLVELDPVCCAWYFFAAHTLITVDGELRVVG